MRVQTCNVRRHTHTHTDFTEIMFEPKTETWNTLNVQFGKLIDTVHWKATSNDVNHRWNENSLSSSRFARVQTAIVCAFFAINWCLAEYRRAFTMCNAGRVFSKENANCNYYSGVNQAASDEHRTKYVGRHILHEKKIEWQIHEKNALHAFMPSKS